MSDSSRSPEAHTAAQLLGAWEERHSLRPLPRLHCGFLGFPLLPDRPGRRKRDIQPQGCWTPAPQSRQASAKRKHTLASRSTPDFSLHSQGPSWELFFKWSLVWGIHKTTDHKEIKLNAEPSFSLLRRLVLLDWMSCDRCFPKSSTCVLSCSVCPALWTPWTVAHQAPLSMGFSRQEYWSGLPCPPPGVFLTQESNPSLLHLLH